MQKSIIRIIKEVSEENGIDEQVVMAVYTSLYSSLRKDINGINREDINTFKNLRIKNFGTLRYNKWRHSVWMKKQETREILSDGLEKESSKTLKPTK